MAIRKATDRRGALALGVHSRGNIAIIRPTARSSPLLGLRVRCPFSGDTRFFLANFALNLRHLGHDIGVFRFDRAGLFVGNAVNQFIDLGEFLVLESAQFLAQPEQHRAGHGCFLLKFSRFAGILLAPPPGRKGIRVRYSDRVSRGGYSCERAKRRRSG